MSDSEPKNFYGKARHFYGSNRKMLKDGSLMAGGFCGMAIVALIIVIMIFVILIHVDVHKSRKIAEKQLELSD